MMNLRKINKRVVKKYNNKIMNLTMQKYRKHLQ
jgi:hypothetical protein